jgi:hypothetical protein
LALSQVRRLEVTRRSYTTLEIAERIVRAVRRSLLRKKPWSRARVHAPAVLEVLRRTSTALYRVRQDADGVIDGNTAPRPLAARRRRR